MLELVATMGTLSAAIPSPGSTLEVVPGPDHVICVVPVFEKLSHVVIRSIPPVLEMTVEAVEFQSNPPMTEV